MRTQRFWWQTAIAAALLVLAAAVTAVAGEEHTVRVEKQRQEGAGETVTVEIDGKATVIGLDDLEEGESRVIGDGAERITVTRKGDRLLVEPGEEASGERIVIVRTDGGGKPMRWVSRSRAVVVGDEDRDDEDVEVIVVPGLHDTEMRRLLEERLQQAAERREAAEQRMKALKEKMAQLKKRLSELKLDAQAELNEELLHRLEALNELEVPPVPPIPEIVVDVDEEHLPGRHQLLWIGEDEDGDMTVLRCEKDDVTMVLPKAAAAGRSFTCPICGKPLEPAEGTEPSGRKVIVKKERRER